MTLPSVFAFCPTYGRPSCVANTIKMWEDMEYEGERELVILDDGNQYPTEPSGETWSIVSVSRRFASFGEKQNAACSFSSSKHDLIVVVEDDDYLAPWTLQAHAAASVRGCLSIPGRFFMEMKDGGLRALTNKRFHDAHAGWAFDRHSFRKVGGYPWIDIPTDKHLWDRFVAAGITAVDSTDPEKGYKPYLVNRPFLDVDHLSRMQCDDPWEEAAKIADLTPVEKLPAANWERDYAKELTDRYEGLKPMFENFSFP